MTAVYPSAILTKTQIPDPGANLSGPPEHDDLHINLTDEMIATQGELGVGPSGPFPTVRARLDAGWQPIAAASFSAATSVDISIPSSTYEIVRIWVRGVLATGPAGLLARVNNNSAADLHIFTRVRNVAGGTGQQYTSTTSTSWEVGVLGDGNSIVEFEIMNAAATSTLPFIARSAAYDITSTDSITTLAGGRLASTTALSSLRLLPASSTMTGLYVCEGYRLP